MQLVEQNLKISLFKLVQNIGQVQFFLRTPDRFLGIMKKKESLSLILLKIKRKKTKMRKRMVLNQSVIRGKHKSYEKKLPLGKNVLWWVVGGGERGLTSSLCL